MVTAIILMNVQRERINETADELAEIKEISEVYSVTGIFDLVAIIRTKTNEAIADLVTKHLAEIDGIEQTDTMLAFKAYSRHDLEAMFSI